MLAGACVGLAFAGSAIAWSGVSADAGVSLSVPSVRVLGAYPKVCLKRVARPSGSGQIAAVLDGKVTIGSPSGGRQVVLPASFPDSSSYLSAVSWSPDGRYLATGDGRLWTATGHPAGDLFAKPDLFWLWSPTGDCVIGVTSPTESQVATLSVGVPGQPARPFLRMRGEGFVFAPNGRALILVAGPFGQPSLVRLDLATGKLVVLLRLPAGTHNVPFGGWAPGGHVLLYWAGIGASIMADGWRLSALDINNGHQVVYGTPRSPVETIPVYGFVAACGSREIGIVGGGRPYGTITDKQLAVLVPGRPAKALTPNTLGYLSPTCSPGGTSIAAVQFPEGGKSNGPARLTLLSTTGAFTRYLTPGGAFTDTSPEWARPGITLARTPTAGRTSQLWFIPKGRTARNTGLRAVASSWSTTWAWSATAPTGVG